MAIVKLFFIPVVSYLQDEDGATQGRHDSSPPPNLSLHKDVLDLFGSIFPKAVQVMSRIMVELRNDLFLLYRRRFPDLQFRPSVFKYSGDADK